MALTLDRESARALVDAGIMPLSEYVAAFAEDAEGQTHEDQNNSHLRRPVRPWNAPAHFKRPLRVTSYWRVRYAS